MRVLCFEIPCCTIAAATCAGLIVLGVFMVVLDDEQALNVGTRVQLAIEAMCEVKSERFAGDESNKRPFIISHMDQ